MAAAGILATMICTSLDNHNHPNIDALRHFVLILGHLKVLQCLLDMLDQ